MIIIDVALAAVALVLVAVVIRALVGPSQADRAVAADLGFFCFVALAALFGTKLDSPAAWDVILIATLTGFVSTIWLARLIRRGK